jgi:phage-related protein (TIGR01555 family)
MAVEVHRTSVRFAIFDFAEFLVDCCRLDHHQRAGRSCLGSDCVTLDGHLIQAPSDFAKRAKLELTSDANGVRCQTLAVHPLFAEAVDGFVELFEHEDGQLHVRLIAHEHDALAHLLWIVLALLVSDLTTFEACLAVVVLGDADGEDGHVLRDCREEARPRLSRELFRNPVADIELIQLVLVHQFTGAACSNRGLVRAGGIFGHTQQFGDTVFDLVEVLAIHFVLSGEVEFCYHKRIMPDSFQVGKHYHKIYRCDVKFAMKSRQYAFIASSSQWPYNTLDHHTESRDMKKLLSRILGRTQPDAEAIKKAEEAERARQTGDPLDVVHRQRGWKGSPPNSIHRTIADFPVATRDGLSLATDSAETISAVKVMDDNGAPCGALSGPTSSYAVPEQLQQWFMAQSFIGYQACAIIAQHWLVDKACSMAGEDAIRNGWEISAVGDDAELSKEDRDALRAYDVPFRVKANLAELDRFKNVFGIRVAIFVVDSDDPKYYEKPFNIDGVTKGSYKGISQIDPYWMMPMMTAESTSDPSSIHFYDPEYWVISGKKYHRSHLVIARGPQPADILKPTYIFGGIPLTQRIYERVYAAERTANEAPLLSLSKRTTALHVDVEKAITNQEKFEQKLLFWIKYRDNHAVKVLGKEETMEQFDTSLADFDAVIMNQYQLVSAIAKVPATKMLGTSPKGFNATGDFEEKSYHEELESIQEHTMAPMVERHYQILCKSLGISCQVEVVFNDVDSMTALKQAELNDKKAETNKKNIEMGAISPEEVRGQLRDDKHSGYNRLSNEDAEETPGMSPENIAAFEKAGQESSEAGAQPANQAAATPPATAGLVENADADTEAGNGLIAALNTPSAPLVLSEPGIVPKTDDVSVISLLKTLTERMMALESHLVPEGVDIEADGAAGIERTAKPGVTGIAPTVAPISAVVPQVDPTKHPKMKVSGMLLSIENPRGTIRQGMNLDGTNWSQKMPHHYGFIRGVSGADGDDLDCFVGPNLMSERVFVVNQNDPESGAFDEHKCMLGFDSMEDATAAYRAAYAPDWKGFGDAVELSMDDFKHWLKSVDGCTSPLQAVCIEHTANAPQMSTNPPLES